MFSCYPPSLPKLQVRQLPLILAGLSCGFFQLHSLIDPESLQSRISGDFESFGTGNATQRIQFGSGNHEHTGAAKTVPATLLTVQTQQLEQTE